jgi:hypothetical protein
VDQAYSYEKRNWRVFLNSISQEIKPQFFSFLELCSGFKHAKDFVCRLLKAIAPNRWKQAWNFRFIWWNHLKYS